MKTEKELEVAWSRGWEDCSKGKSDSENPYDDVESELQAEWQEAWYTADAQGFWDYRKRGYLKIR